MQDTLQSLISEKVGLIGYYLVRPPIIHIRPASTDIRECRNVIYTDIKVTSRGGGRHGKVGGT